jgi:FkbM family methyltransferase
MKLNIIMEDQFDPANYPNTKSQCLQDALVLFELKNKREGYFVDFGATDGVTINNTVLLEREYGWKGIVAEPNSFYFDDLMKNRFCCITNKCVFNESGKQIEFLNATAPDISTIKGYSSNDKFKEDRENGVVSVVDTISLFDLLEQFKAPTEIDYLSIDTEGSELMILEAFIPNPKYTFKIITVEHNYTPMRDQLYSLLTQHGYVRKYEHYTQWDDFYIKE